MKYILPILLLLIISCQPPTTLQINETNNYRAKIDSLALTFKGDRDYVQMAIGIIDGDKIETFFIGDSVNANTLFEIGSITKTFTGITLARLHNAGVLNLQDSIDIFLPDSVQYQKKDFQPVRLWHLTTHTSGMPQIPLNLIFNVKDQTNPYKDYSPADMFDFLPSYSPDNFEKGINYSNYAVGMLGYCIANRESLNIESILRKYVIDDLKMNNTRIQLNENQRQNFITGYTAEGDYQQPWDFTDATSSAGALKSNISDMMIYLKANMQPDNSTLGKAIQKSQKPLFDGGRNQIGCGWFLQEDMIGHDGATYGYNSSMMFDKTKQKGVVVLVNTFDMKKDVNSLAIEMMRKIGAIN